MTKFIIKSYLIWTFFVLIIIYFSTKIVTLQPNFLGGGLSNYIKNPILWSLANFDGEHYLAIAQEGYKPLTHFFFPVYPLLIRFLGNSIFSALVISHLSFVIALIGLYKLIKLDYSDSIAKLSIILMLVFPTSFYFAAVYTESLFLCLVVWSFYFYRTKKYLLSGILGGVASATRLVGIILLPSYISRIKKNLAFSFLAFSIIPIGLMGYMFYLYKTTGDALAFFNNVSIFGAQRSSKLIILPQVFYRYLVKIIPNLNYSYFPVVFTTFLEISVAALFLILIIYSFKKIRYDYWIYMSVGYLIPTLAGSFSSLPRYVLVLFPFFIMISLILEKNKLLRFTFLCLSGILLAVSLSLFARGYWIS